MFYITYQNLNCWKKWGHIAYLSNNSLWNQQNSIKFKIFWQLSTVDLAQKNHLIFIHIFLWFMVFMAPFVVLVFVRSYFFKVPPPFASTPIRRKSWFNHFLVRTTCVFKQGSAFNGWMFFQKISKTFLFIFLGKNLTHHHSPTIVTKPYLLES